MWEQVGLSHSFLGQLCARLSARPCEAAPVCRQSGPLSRGRGRKRGEKGEAGSAGGLQGSRSRWGVLCKAGWRWGGGDGLGAVPQRPAPCSRSGGPRAPHWVLELFVGITRQRSHSPPSLRLGSCCLLWTLHPCWLASCPESPQLLSPTPQDGSPVSPPLSWPFLDVTDGHSPPSDLCSMPTLLGSPSARPSPWHSCLGCLCCLCWSCQHLQLHCLHSCTASFLLLKQAHSPHLDILCPCHSGAARHCGMGVCLLPALPLPRPPQSACCDSIRTAGAPPPLRCFSVPRLANPLQ